MTERLAAVTHNGKFHADEVFASAVLRHLYPKLEVIRSRDSEQINKADFVYDVGGVYDHQRCRYDHHQPGAHKRENGLTYSAFGLIWLHYGLDYCDGAEDTRTRIDDILVRGIDAGDNSERNSFGDSRAPEYGISQVIEQLNPIHGTNETYDSQFGLAVSRASDILSRLREKVDSEQRSFRQIQEARQRSSDRRFAELDRPIELSDSIAAIEGLEYLIFPEFTNNTWQVYAVAVPGNPFEQKHPLPASWAGLMNEDMASTSGIPDAIFCHSKHFLAVAKSREGALALLAKALQ